MVLWDVEDPISSLWFANGLELWNNILMSKQNMLTKSIRHVMMEELLHKFLKVSVKVWHFFLRRYHCFLHWHGVTFLRRSCANYKTPRLLVLKEKMEKRWQTSHMHKTTGYAGERKVMQNTKNLKKKKKSYDLKNSIPKLWKSSPPYHIFLLQFSPYTSTGLEYYSFQVHHFQFLSSFPLRKHSATGKIPAPSHGKHDCKLQNLIRSHFGIFFPNTTCKRKWNVTIILQG